MLRDQICRDAMQIKSLATAQDGCQNFLRLGRSKNKFHMLWRLLQRFQKRVERGRRKHVDLVDEIDFVTPFGRRIPDVLAQLAHVLDAVVACAVDLDHVKTVAAGDLAAVVAHAAWRNRGTLDAVERLCQNSCRRSFAHAARANKKVCVREPVLRHRIFQRARDVSLTDQIVKRLRPILSGEDLVIHFAKSRSFLRNVILSEAKKISDFSKSLPPMKTIRDVESLASCFAFRCSASLNMT